ncbi:melanotransferrin [Diorhabda carinulata]|uniref:melanotransferrin n=1 Tax=Diorhabda carinulata TaxID=1163345 RepID=UPI0025A03E90|nr:melanotransferrin [Diorhabda carinulata]
MKVNISNGNFYISVILIFNIIVEITCQNFWKINSLDREIYRPKEDKIIWCTITPEEQQKCRNFSWANERDQIKVGYKTIKIECVQASNKKQCMELLDQEKATMTTLDAGAVFTGGRYHSLVPIAQERLEGGFNYYYAVAVVKVGSLSYVNSLHHLRGTKACFAGVETFAGWILPINTLMKEGGMDIVDCNNHVKSAINYFGPSCAVNCLTDQFNPIGDNSDKLCQLCVGKIPGGRCTDSDPYAGYEGAFRCLLEAGEIAFLKHNTVQELLSGLEFGSLDINNFQLLCKDGSRRPLSEYLACNWGKVPSDAVVVSSAVSYEERTKLQRFLQKFAERYPKLNRNLTESTNQNQFDQNRNPYDQSYNNNRFKRQNNYNDYNPYTRNDNNGYNRNNQNDDNPYTRYEENNPYVRNDGNNPYTNNQNSNDPFNRDPYTINRDQFGVNIDPYGNSNENNPYGNTNEDNPYGNPNDNNPYNPFNTGQSQDNYPGRNQTVNITYYEVFDLFESSPKYGIHLNLLFQDSTREIIPVPESQQTYTTFLGDSLETIMGVRSCPVAKVTLCVTSEAEKNKCIKMRTALKAQLMKPEMECYKGHSQIHCMQAIRSGTADVAVLDASDVYTAGLNFDLIPFISEVYNLEEPEYYVVAVGKESDPSTELTYLKNKNTCHGGINTAAGWVYPLAFLLSNGWMRPYGCNSIRAAAEYFSKSCVPGAISTEYNTGVPYDNMCDLCHGSSFRYCRRDASEDYYGHTGAFRCLVEGGGHVAFVKHTTVTENTGGKKREWWTRDNLNDDYELLCPDGTRAEINEYTKCNLGKVKANAIVTRGGYGYNETHINSYINLFLYAQTFYGRKFADEFSFSMFSSQSPYSDLIFQDATTQLKVIPPNQRHYPEYLGKDFMRARRIVDCHAGGSSLTATLVAAAIPMFILRLLL